MAIFLESPCVPAKEKHFLLGYCLRPMQVASIYNSCINSQNVGQASTMFRFLKKKSAMFRSVFYDKSRAFRAPNMDTHAPFLFFENRGRQAVLFDLLVSYDRS
jgi:hypothetical protein